MSLMKRIFKLTAVSAALLAAYGVEPVAAQQEDTEAAQAAEPVPTAEPVQTIEPVLAPEPTQAAETEPAAEPAQAPEAESTTEQQPAAADEEVTRLTEPESSVSIGIGNWDRDRHREGRYDGMRESGAYGLLDAEIVKRDDATGTWYILNGRNLGLDNREIKAEWLRQGNIGLSLEYSRIPRDSPFTVNTGLQGIGTTTQIVSGAGVTTSPAFPFQDVELGTARDLTQIGIYKNIQPNLDFNLLIKNEEKNGSPQWGRGQEATFVVERIDTTTQQLEMTLSYTGEQLQLSGGYYGSRYDNKNQWVSVFASPGTGTPTILSLPLDNQAHQLFVDGGYNFGETTRGTFKLSYTRATMNEKLDISDALTTAGVAVFPGAPSKLDGEVNTTLAQLGLSARPIKNLAVVASLRYHDVQDDTPVARFIQTNPACSAGNECINNTPFSYQTITGKLEGTYRLPAGYSVTAGLEQRNQDRTVPVGTLNASGQDLERVVPMRAELDERTGRIELRRSLSETLNGSLAFVRSERDGSSFVLASAGQGGPPSDLINPIHIADRDRNKVRLALDWAPLENLSFQFGYEDARDKYHHDATRPYGLHEGSAKLYSVDGNYVLDDNWQITAWYSHDRAEATQLGSRAVNGGGTGGLTDKDSRLKDTGHSAGIGVAGNALAKLKIGTDVQWTRTNSEYHQTLLTPGTASGLTNLPDIKNTVTRVEVFGQYALRKNSDIRLDLAYERWQTDDWTWQFANGTPFVYTGVTPNPTPPPASLFTDGTTVNARPLQESAFVGVRYIFRFQ
jgi:MtrB/PioB family decaheme-associated outer membrane protein